LRDTIADSGIVLCAQLKKLPLHFWTVENKRSIGLRIDGAHSFFLPPDEAGNSCELSTLRKPIDLQSRTFCGIGYSWRHRSRVCLNRLKHRALRTCVHPDEALFRTLVSLEAVTNNYYPR